MQLRDERLVFSGGLVPSRGSQLSSHECTGRMTAGTGEVVGAIRAEVEGPGVATESDDRGTSSLDGMEVLVACFPFLAAKM